MEHNQISHIEGIEYPAKEIVEPHYHEDSRGLVHACYHKCKSVFTDFGFWAGMTLGFPLEHYIWEKLPGFRHITELMGL